MFHIAEGVAGRSPSGKLVVEAARLQPMCRLGGVTYGRVTELFDLPRPSGRGAGAAGGGGGAAAAASGGR